MDIKEIFSRGIHHTVKYRSLSTATNQSRHVQATRVSVNLNHDRLGLVI